MWGGAPPATGVRESCVQLTTWARDGFGPLVDGLVIADDGAVRLAEHDNGDPVVLAPGCTALLEENVHDRPRHGWTSRWAGAW